MFGIEENDLSKGSIPKKKISQIVEKVHKGGGGAKSKIKKVYISNVDIFLHFSQIQNSPHYPRGGGQENYGLFLQFGTFSFANAPLTYFAAHFA